MHFFSNVFKRNIINSWNNKRKEVINIKINEMVLKYIAKKAVKEAIPEQGWPPKCQYVLYQPKRPQKDSNEKERK